ncbi:MAG: hypothetical protein V4534_08065 [Myxococcota bacterium]
MRFVQVVCGILFGYSLLAGNFTDHLATFGPEMSDSQKIDALRSHLRLHFSLSGNVEVQELANWLYVNLGTIQPSPMAFAAILDMGMNPSSIPVVPTGPVRLALTSLSRNGELLPYVRSDFRILTLPTELAKEIRRIIQLWQASRGRENLAQ